MGSQSDDESRKTLSANQQGRVVEDDRGHQVWEGTIKTIKLSLMKTGIFFKSEAQQRLQALHESDSENAREDLEEELEIVDGGGGFDPYDSSSK